MEKIEVEISKDINNRYVGYTKLNNQDIYSYGSTIEECKHNMVNNYEDAAMEEYEYKELDDEIHFIFSYNEELPIK